MILDKFPEINEFYETYWNKKPFIVKNAIDNSIFDKVIEGDILAGLSLEEDIKSRIVITDEDNKNWQCKSGPFAEEDFSKLGDKNWSLLVQNVEQYHVDTSELLKSFNFSPRWLMDDVMVSYSAIGGGVGPHMDSYHVFLVQGIGKRKWKISSEVIKNPKYINNEEILVLVEDFDGFEVEVEMGDIIYIPPYFGHSGITLENAMTFSVGFLGPKMSEMLGEYSHYLEQDPKRDARYAGVGLNELSTPFSIDKNAIENIKSELINKIKSDDFNKWLSEYFSVSTHGEMYVSDEDKGNMKTEELKEILENGKKLHKPEYIKTAITKSDNGNYNLSIYGKLIEVPENCKDLIGLISKNISIQDINVLDNNLEIMNLLTRLYNDRILTLSD